MSCFNQSAFGAFLQVPEICKNVQNIWWKVLLLGPWSNFTNDLSLSLSCLPLFFALFVSLRWHVIVSPSVTESCKRLELGCIRGNTHTHKGQCVKHTHLKSIINFNLAHNLCYMVPLSLTCTIKMPLNVNVALPDHRITANPTHPLPTPLAIFLAVLWSTRKKGGSEFLFWGENLKMNVGRIL